jgi:glycosyltransferase involved in cell wall biosynthesis
LYLKEAAEAYSKVKNPIICTSYANKDILMDRYGKFPDLGELNIIEVVHDGIDKTEYQCGDEKKNFVAWVGRFDSKKKPEAAIKAAIKAGCPIILAGSITFPSEKAYFEKEILPYIEKGGIWDEQFLDKLSKLSEQEQQKLLTPGRVIFIGEVDNKQKQTLFSQAKASLHLIKYTETFGLTMAESMACGTPVIGCEQIGDFFCGSVKEVIDEGITGYKIVAENDNDLIDKAAHAINKVAKLDPRHIRNVFEEKWSADVSVGKLEKTVNKFLQLDRYINDERQQWADKCPKKTFSTQIFSSAISR